MTKQGSKFRIPSSFIPVFSLNHKKRKAPFSKFTLLFASLLLVAALPMAIMQSGLDNAEPIGAFLNGNLPQSTPGGAFNWSVVDAYPGLSFDKPLAFVPDPNSGSSYIYVAEREGKIYHFENGPNASTTKSLSMDITERVAGQVWDGGLLSLSFHPRFGTDSNYVYLYYSARTPFANYPTTSQGTGFPGTFFNVWGRLSRFTVNPQTRIIDPNSELIMINKRLYNGSHRGGGMAFGNDGFLYLAVGDEFRYQTAQDMETQLEGGVLRIDVDRNPAKGRAPIRTLPLSNADELSGVGYFIPFDNPFLDPMGNSFEEYYSLGHRNPHRMSFDSLSNSFWIGEVGGNAREEVNIITSGGNYGFPFREGTIVGPRNPPSSIIGTVIEPVAEFAHNTSEDMGAIIGGYVYRGSEFPSLYGKYFCMGHGSGEIWTIDYNAVTSTATKELIATAGFSGISTFGLDHQGEMYIMRNNPNSKIYKLAASTSPDPPQLLSQVGAFSDLDLMIPEDGIIPYELIEPFWSDDAEKYRWIMIPNDGTPDTQDEQIQYKEEGDWEFPIGTVIIKHFEMSMDETDPSVKRKLETRFLVHGNDGKYYGLTYKWNSNQTDADLLNTFEEDTLSIATSGFPREEVWYYPGRGNCLNCHNEASKGALGPNSRQFNKDIVYPLTGRAANQILTFEHLNFFNPDVDTTNLGGILTSKAKYDPVASLKDRALTYLDANCSSCHMPGTDNRAVFDARLPIPLKGKQLVFGNVLDDLGIPGAKILIPGDTNRSVLFQRLKAVHSDIAMPPLAKNKVDTAGVRLLGEWIMALDKEAFVTGTGLEGTYYNNDNFTNLVKTQVDPNINFYWGVSGPPGYSNPNQLSIRWTGQILPLFSETYTFKTYSDDGVRLWINGQLIIDDWNKNGTRTNTASISLTGGQKVDIVLEYLQGSGLAFVDLSWESESQAEEIIPTHLLFPPNSANKSQTISLGPISDKATTDGPFSIMASASSGLTVSLSLVEGDGTVANLSGGNTITLTGAVGPVTVRAVQNGGTSGPDNFQEAPAVEESFFVFSPGTGQGTGLTATYYNDKNLSSIAFSRVDPQIDFEWESTSPDPSMQSNSFSVKWEGEIEIPSAGTYNFITSTDDGVRLWINSNLIIDQWQDQGNTSFSGSISLGAGKVPILMEYYENQAYASAQLKWTTTGIPLQIIPQAFLYPAPVIFPISFLDFEARVNPTQEVELVWSGIINENAHLFQVERSKDGNVYERISDLIINSDQEEIQQFEYLDQTPLRGESFYRIKQIDIDGAYIYSKVRTVFVGEDIFNFYPNPLGKDRMLKLGGKFSSAASIQLTDHSGRILLTKELVKNPQHNSTQINLQSLDPGLYFITLILPNQRITQKILLN